MLTQQPSIRIARQSGDSCNESKVQWTSIHDQYRTLDVLGQGTYGIVYRAEHRATGKIVALKRCRLDIFKDFGIPETTLREIVLLRDLQHENIMRLYKISCNTERLYMICEYLPSDLKKYIRSHADQSVPIRKIKEITYKILKGLAYCHGHQIIHRDLKPHNILVDEEANQVKLADFGLARCLIYPGKTLTHEVVTLWYRAPELLLGDCTYSTGIDIWSAGCIVLEMLQGHPLFMGDSEIDTLFKICRLLGTPSQSEWPKNAVVRWEDFPHFKRPHNCIQNLRQDLNQHGISFLKSMLHYDASKRSSAVDLLNHPWLDEVRYHEPKTLESHSFRYYSDLSEDKFPFVMNLHMTAEYPYTVEFKRFEQLEINLTHLLHPTDDDRENIHPSKLTHASRSRLNLSYLRDSSIKLVDLYKGGQSDESLAYPSIWTNNQPSKMSINPYTTRFPPHWTNRNNRSADPCPDTQNTEKEYTNTQQSQWSSTCPMRHHIAMPDRRSMMPRSIEHIVIRPQKHRSSYLIDPSTMTVESHSAISALSSSLSHSSRVSQWLTELKKKSIDLLKIIHPHKQDIQSNPHHDATVYNELQRRVMCYHDGSHSSCPIESDIKQKQHSLAQKSHHVSRCSSHATTTTSRHSLESSSSAEQQTDTMLDYPEVQLYHMDQQVSDYSSNDLLIQKPDAFTSIHQLLSLSNTLEPSNSFVDFQSCVPAFFPMSKDRLKSQDKSI